jgi:hypothetical protein
VAALRRRSGQCFTPSKIAERFAGQINRRPEATLFDFRNSANATIAFP